MVNLKIQVREDQLELLERLAGSSGATKSSIIRGLIDLHQDNYKQQKALDVITKMISKWKYSVEPKIQDQHGNKYVSVTEVCQKLGLHDRLVRRVLDGVRNHTGGYNFKYIR